MKKPTFTAEQLTSASAAAKNFGSLRKKAKKKPQFITENGTVGEVLLDYKHYEELYHRLTKLKEQEEKRNSWGYAINLNQIVGEYKPSPLLSELINNEIRGELSLNKLVEILKLEFEQTE